MKEAGIVALSDDGKTVKSAEVMRRCIEYAKTFSLPVICHCEDADLAARGVMHEGIVSTRLGMRGIAPAAEELIVAREIALAEWVGHPVHIAHVSTAGSVRIIREAKARGVAVTAETAPHYFTLTDEAVASFDTATKVNPPLRTQQDLEAIRQGLQDGTLDVIASDHAPHSSLEKDVEFDNAAFGMIGLETSLPLTLSLVAEGVLTLMQALEKYTVNPARILHLPKGRIQSGCDADITIIDPQAEYVLDKDRLCSKSSNSPFLGRRFKGLRSLYYRRRLHCLSFCGLIPHCILTLSVLDDAGYRGATRSFGRTMSPVMEDIYMPKILVVDDEKSIREMLEIYLQREGYAVSCACDGLDALARCEQEPFDVIIADIKMPRMDGITLLQRVRDFSPQTIFIMITAFASYETARESMHEDAYDYITKPFYVEDIKRKIDAALEKRAQAVDPRLSGEGCFRESTGPILRHDRPEPADEKGA